MTRIIFLTGMHRSGTTFFGKFLNSFENTYYIHEPLNPSNRINHLGFIQKYYWKLPLHQDNNLKGFINIKKYIYPLKKNIKLSSNFKDLLKSFYFYFLTIFAKIKSSKIVIKDPFFLFYVNYFKKMNILKKSDVIIIIRDPLNFVASCVKRNWDFDFNNFLKQKNILNFFSKKEVVLMKMLQNCNKIEKLAYLWKILSSKIIKLKKKDENINLVFYNNFLLDEKKNSKIISKKIQLNFGIRNEKFLEKIKKKNYGNKASNINRIDPIKDLKNYKKTLSKKDIIMIKKVCNKEFYILKKIFKKRAVI